MSVRSLIASAQPRDTAHAARSLAILTAVAGLVTLVFAPLSPGSSRASILTTIGVGLVVLLFAARVWRRRRLPALAWTLGPYIALLCIVGEDLLTKDASVSAQVFLFFPVLFAGKQLRSRAAAAATLAALVAEICVVYSLPFWSAVVSFGYVGSALLTTGAVLISAAQRQDHLLRQLRRQAAIDPLTGLATRTVLDQAAVSALSGAASGEGTALALLDIDAFKRINDTYGHPAGDQALIQVAALLSAECLPSDVVSRLGGDEIAVLLPGCSLDAALTRTERLLTTIRAHRFDLGVGAAVTISVSIGVAHAPSHANDLRGLYATADEAMYRAKRGGKDQIAAALTRS